MNHDKHRMSPLTALFLGATMTIVTIVVSVSMITLYGMNLGSRWGDDLIALTRRTIDHLPDIASSLPPILADALNDRRAPEYVDQLRAEVEPVAAPQPPGWRPVVAIENRGDRMVTLLSLRVLALSECAFRRMLPLSSGNSCHRGGAQPMGRSFRPPGGSFCRHGRTVTAG
jgi:hypothetical protein